MLLNKVKRLLIPAYLFGILFSITLSLNTLTIKNITNGYIHLWFLPSLFWCFVFAPVFVRKRNYIIECILLIITFFFIYIPLPQYLGLGSFHIYFFYFVLGITLAKYQNLFNFIFSQKRIKLFLYTIALFSLVFIILFDKNGYTDQPLFRFSYHSALIPIIRIIYKITAITSIVITIKHLNLIHDNKLFQTLNRTSYGIYIFHMWIMYLMIKNEQIAPFIKDFATNHYIVFPFIYFAISLFIAFYITLFIKRTKIGNSII